MQSELNVNVTDQQVVVTGVHTCSHKSMCITRSLNRKWDLSLAEISLDGVTAEQTSDGVLQITLPKVAPLYRGIPITSVSENAQPQETGSETSIGK